MATTKDITETIVQDLNEVVLDKNVVRNLAVMKDISRNNRSYSEKSMKQITDYINEGSPTKSFLDHGDMFSGGTQSVLKLLGTFSDARQGNGTIYADLEMLESSVGKDVLIDVIEHQPEIGIGFSIHAQGVIGDKKDSEGREVCTEIKFLHSIDLVGSPATVSSLSEEEQVDREEKIRVLEEKNKVLEEKVEELEERIGTVEDRLEAVEQISSEGQRMSDNEARKILHGDTVKPSEKKTKALSDEDAREKLLDAFLPENKQVYEA